MIHVTNKAVSEIKKQLQNRGTPDGSFRLGIKSGGCDGFMYHYDFEDDEPTENDSVFHFNDLRVMIDQKSIVYLNEFTLDYQDTLMYRGFKFINRNETSRCGCGKSFNL